MRSVLMMTIFISLFSCNSNQSPASESEKSTLSLNEGKKWNVNNEMKPHIEEARKMVANYIADEDNDYELLHTRLKKQNELLIKSCTMKGASHDELHKWLHPHITLVKSLGEADNSDAAQEYVALLETSFNNYSDYFD